MSTPTRLIVGITGATGTIFGVRLLEMLRATNVETHLVMSRWAARTLVHETAYTMEQVQQMATQTYQSDDQGAAISSGSFLTSGMVIAPCSMRTLAAIANGYGDTLIHRAADVILKERRKLVLRVREAHLSDIHLENMLKLSRMGVVIVPPVPAFALSVLLQKSGYSLLAIFSHPRDGVDVNARLQRRIERHAIHLVEQPLREHDGGATRLRKGRDVSVNFRLEPFIMEDLVDETDLLGFIRARFSAARN